MCIKQLVGKGGEEKACEYLKKRGYEIIKTNFSCREGEIDIIAKDKNRELVFIEVKTRRNFAFGMPSESINLRKQEHIKKVANYYLYQNKIIDVPVRFDAIEVLIGKTYLIHHIKQAFQ